MKRALVTGGTRGIGFEVCKLLLEKGYLVTALYSKDEESAKQAKARLKGVEFLRADVSKEKDIKRVFEEIPSLDLLVNNAGVELYKLAQDTAFEEWRHVMDVNAGGAFLCAKHAVKKMLDKGGSIVNISSVWGQTGGSMESVYSASKGAMIAFTKALAKELAPMNVTVNCVSPGVIDTDMMKRFSAEEKRALSEEIPLGRLGTPQEVAEAVLFLAEHKYITGEVLSVNGGFYM
ncbi:MAG: SDR family oxidoreductase [Clostridia bacterium]|nr:SDR family oxidoreductase [Clostridia bacterium]